MSIEPVIKNQEERKRTSIALDKALLWTFFCVLLVWGCNLASCSRKKDFDNNATIGEAKVVAVFIRPDGVKEIGIMLRVINKGVKYDSLNKKDAIIVDTVWGKPILIDDRDSTGNQ
jgi:uncharacterized membrane protein